MSISDVLRPDGPDYDAFLHAKVGDDASGAAVTVLSALARLGLEPWTEAQELARLNRQAAQVRLKAHLSAISDIPALDRASGSVATRLVALLPTRASQGAPKLPDALRYNGPLIPVRWVLVALVCGLVLARFVYLAQGG